MLPDSSTSPKEPGSGLSETLINFYKKNIIIEEEKEDGKVETEE